MRPNSDQKTPAAARKALQAKRDREALALGRYEEVATVTLCTTLSKCITARDLTGYKAIEAELRQRLTEKKK